MPFTPLHMGAGLLIKAGAGRRMSLVAFGTAQVAMDLQPGIAMLCGWPILHGWTHTWIAALGIGLGLIPLTHQMVLRTQRRWQAAVQRRGLHWIPCGTAPTAAAIAAGCLIGTLSHVVLDAFMHADMRPLWPFSDTNRLLGWISLDALHLGCIGAGMVGGALWLLRSALRCACRARKHLARQHRS